MEKTFNTHWLLTFLFCLFFGGLGIHRFINGKIGTGILQILTLGGLGIWTLVDFILIACEKFTDSNDKPITVYVEK